jgi:hypothetical protein
LYDKKVFKKRTDGTIYSPSIRCKSNKFLGPDTIQEEKRDVVCGFRPGLGYLIIFKSLTNKLNNRMSQHLRMGALNKENNKYEKPSTADKKNKYICPECKGDVIVKKGTIKVHHFAHKSQEDPCIYYKHPSETQIHKDAKMLMKNILESKRVLSFNRYCLDCEKAVKKIVVDAYTESTKIEVEHRFQYNDALQIADVAYLDSNEIKFIFEICHKHKTRAEKRPEPWFEIQASSFINSMNDNNDKIICIREETCEECVRRRELQIKEEEEERKRRIAEAEEWERDRPKREERRIAEAEEERKRRIAEAEEWERDRPKREEIRRNIAAKLQQRKDRYRHVAIKIKEDAEKRRKILEEQYVSYSQ